MDIVCVNLWMLFIWVDEYSGRILSYEEVNLEVW